MDCPRGFDAKKWKLLSEDARRIVSDELRAHFTPVCERNRSRDEDQWSRGNADDEAAGSSPLGDAEKSPLVSFCDMLHIDEPEDFKNKKHVRLAQDTFDKAIRDASTSFRQLRRLEKLEDLTNDRARTGLDLIDMHLDKIIKCINRRRDDLKQQITDGQMRQQDAVLRSKEELKSLHRKCRSAELASREALSTLDFSAFLPKYTEFRSQSTIGDGMRRRIATEIERMEQKYALSVSFRSGWDKKLTDSLRGLGTVTVRGVPPRFLSTSVHIDRIFAFSAPTSLDNMTERKKWATALLLVFEPWVGTSAVAPYVKATAPEGNGASSSLAATKDNDARRRTSSFEDEESKKRRISWASVVSQGVDAADAPFEGVSKETAPIASTTTTTNYSHKVSPALTSLTERIAMDWCVAMYGLDRAHAMADRMIKDDPSILRAGTVWKAVASGDGHYLRRVMNHPLPHQWFDKHRGVPPRATLLYRASRDGWRVQNFHSMCDSKGPTLTVVKTGNGCVFGGYTNVAWNSSGRNTTSSEAWLFSIRSMTGSPPTKMPIKPSQKMYATFRAGNYSATFGGGHDLFIADNANVCSSSYSNLGHTYTIPPGQGTTGSAKAQMFLAGSYNFTPTEIEVYAILGG